MLRKGGSESTGEDRVWADKDCEGMMDGVMEDPFMGISKSGCLNDDRYKDLFWMVGVVSTQDGPSEASSSIHLVIHMAHLPLHAHLVRTHYPLIGHPSISFHRHCRT